MSKKNKTTEVNNGTIQWPNHNGINASQDNISKIPAFLKEYRKRSISSKTTIYRESEQADAVYVIRSGLVKLLSYLPNGRARIVRLHGRDAWIGLGGLLNQSYEHTAVAITDLEIYAIPVNKLLALKMEDPDYFFQFLTKWYEYLCDADTWISSFSTGAIKPRVARLINFLSDIEYGKSAEIVELLTVHEMADILGVTPESVSRTLAEFKRSDILHRLEKNQSNGLYQLNTQALQNMACH